MLLSPALYPAVRASLDLSLDEESLPDDVIGLGIYQGAAEASVLASDPSAASRTGSDLAHVQNAVVFLTAARLAVALPSITSESANGVSYGRQAKDWAAVAASLRARAAGELGAYLTSDLTPGRPTTFSLASGQRGR